MSGHETEKPHAGNWTGICGEALSLPSKGKPFSHVASQSKPNKIAGHEMSQLEKKKKKNSREREKLRFLGCM